MPRFSLPGLLAATAVTTFVTVSAPIATAQEPTPTVAAAWDAFRQAAPGDWIVRWHAATGTPRAIYGQGLALDDWRGNTLDEARRQAGRALERYAALLGTGASTFAETIGARMGRTWTFTFEQSYGGLPVIGGRVDVRIHMSGRLCYLGSTAFPVAPSFDVVPTLSAEAATAIAWQQLGTTPTTARQPGLQRQPRLVIWADAEAATPGGVELAWEVPIAAVAADGQGPVGRAYVDARTGAWLHYTDDKHECGLPGCTLGRDGSAAPSSAAAAPAAPPPPATYTVMGWLHTGYSPATTPTNEPLVGVQVDVLGYGTFLTDQNGQFTANLTAPTQVTVDLDGVHCNLVQGSNPLTATVTLQPGTPQTIQIGAVNSTQNELAHTTCYYWVWQINELLRSLHGNTPQMLAIDGIQPTVNINSTCNAYYVGNSINFYRAGGSCNNTATASVVSHEWGHGIDDQYGGISQTNGLSEGWGDICSMYLLDDPVIGHGFYTNGGGIRNGNNTRQYPTGSGVHAQGQSWMGFAWKFRQNLRATLGTQQAIAISNDVVLASIAANAQNQADAVVAAFLADDNDGNLSNGVPHYAELEAACLAHSLPYPQILDGYLDNPTVLGATRDQLVPRFVEVDAVPNNGAFTQVRLHYDDGQPRVRTMAPTGVTDRYRALLPGVMSPRTLSYHFEATHGGGATFRMPPSGEYSYVTLADQRVWSDDFENGGQGWTHGAYYGVDEWEIAAPAGRTGFGWTDPAHAASGSLCAGVDLTGDGAYSPSSSIWLRSPTIDCSAYDNLKVRCQRWSSCEPGFLDQLALYVNGQLAWLSNYLIADTGWTTFEFLVPAANHNPAVVLEFRLTSDASGQMGGWQIDDVELVSTAGTVALGTALTLLPEQAVQGTPLQLSITTPASQPFVWVLGGQPGPTLIPGIPALHVGGAPVTFFDYTDASGHYALGINAPATAPLQGIVWYSQVLTLTPTFTFETSNPFVNLFTQ